MKLNIENFKIEFPEHFKDDFSEEQFKEWLLFQIDDTSHISKYNPLINIRLKDCKKTYKKAFLNGKEIKL